MKSDVEKQQKNSDIVIRLPKIDVFPKKGLFQ